MKIILGILFGVAGSMALLLNTGLALACPEELECGNFTDYDKIQDCEYIVDQDLDYEEEQEVLCILWDQSYEFEPWEFQDYPPLDPELALESGEIDNSSLILASKIIIFGLINYFIFSFLTKSSIFLKWLAQ